jgi:pimeloyl-ACP methyl ester carboxylesterase
MSTHGHAPSGSAADTSTRADSRSTSGWQGILRAPTGWSSCCTRPRCPPGTWPRCSRSSRRSVPRSPSTLRATAHRPRHRRSGRSSATRRRSGRRSTRSERSGNVQLFGRATGTVLAVEMARQRPEVVGGLAVYGLPLYTDAERRERLASDFGAPYVPVLDGSHVQTLWDRIRGQYPQLSPADVEIHLRDHLATGGDFGRGIARCGAMTSAATWRHSRCRCSRSAARRTG